MLSSFISRSSRSRDSILHKSPAASPKVLPSKVLVTGASGRTGSIVVRKLLEQGCGEGKTFSCVRALVRSEESAEKLVNSLGDLPGAEIVYGDVTETEQLEKAFEGMDAVIICTSAQPRISKMSLAKIMALRLFSLGQVSGRPQFWYDEGQGPEQVDWLGQQAQFQAAEAAGVRHVVLVSSMCGTKQDHFLNANMGNIVLWKRKAECALTKSGLPYTIIHPGGLLPRSNDFGEQVEGRQRQLYVGVDDTLLENKTVSMIPREDLAEVCVRCLLEPDVAAGRSFDLGSGLEGKGDAFQGRPGQLKALLDTLGDKNCAYTEADEHFIALEPQNGRGCHCY